MRTPDAATAAATWEVDLSCDPPILPGWHLAVHAMTFELFYSRRKDTSFYPQVTMELILDYGSIICTTMV